MILTRSIAILIIVSCLGTTFVFGLLENNNLFSPQQISEVKGEEEFAHGLQPITSQLKPQDENSSQQDKNSSQYEIILSIDEKWDEVSIPIPLKMTVRNNSSEVVYLLLKGYNSVEGLTIKDAEGNIVPLIEDQSNLNSSDQNTIKVDEGRYISILIEPKKEYVESINIGKHYNLQPLKEYSLTIKKYIYLANPEREIIVTSAPLKLVIKSDKE